MVMVCTYLSIYLNIHFPIHPSISISISTYVCMPPIARRRRTIEFATVVVLGNQCFFFSFVNWIELKQGEEEEEEEDAD